MHNFQKRVIEHICVSISFATVAETVLLRRTGRGMMKKCVSVVVVVVAVAAAGAVVVEEEEEEERAQCINFHQIVYNITSFQKYTNITFLKLENRLVDSWI